MTDVRFRSTRSHTRCLLMSALLGLAVQPMQASAQTLTWLGSLGTPYAEAYGVSANGAVVAGWAGVLNPHYAFRWTPATGMQSLGGFGGSPGSEAYGLSADGTTVVGYSFISSSVYRAFRWRDGMMTDLGTLGGTTSWAWGVSADGTYIVGGAHFTDGRNRAFRWSEAGGMQNLGTLPGGIRSVARAVSADGSVVAGWSGFSSGIHHAFRWVNGVMSSIHNPAFGQSEGMGISGDGEVVVGAWGDASFTPARAFRWTASTGMVDLGTLGGAWSEAWAANQDGSVVVGWAERAQGDWRAYRWTVSRGMEDLNVVFASIISPPGSILRDARGISPDGRYIVGRGFNAQTGRNEAYLLDTLTTPPCYANCDGSTASPILNVADFTCFLQQFAAGCAQPSPCYANCDGSTAVPFLNVADFTCFLQRFAAGCP